MKRILCLLGHSYTRYSDLDDDMLADGWGYLHCDRCGKDGYMNLEENEYDQP
jgi:hypothetical protein